MFYNNLFNFIFIFFVSPSELIIVRLILLPSFFKSSLKAIMSPEESLFTEISLSSFLMPFLYAELVFSILSITIVSSTFLSPIPLSGNSNDLLNVLFGFKYSVEDE